MKNTRWILHSCFLLSIFIACNAAKAQTESTCFTLLKVEASGLHDLQEQLDARITIVPWQKADSCDILMSGKGRPFGRRTAIFYAQSPDSRQSAEMKTMPVYDGGRALSDLAGFSFQCIPRKDGFFDLAANGTPPGFAIDDLIYYKNTGRPGKPEFAKAGVLLLEGKSLKEAFNQAVSAWLIEDFNGDDVPDLVMAAHSKSDPNRYWPGGESMWSGVSNPDTGAGCGYDIEGNWLGFETIRTLYWARGFYTKSGELQFEGLRRIFYCVPGFAVQWKCYFTWGALGAIRLDGKKYLLYAGNIDKVYAMPVSMVGDDLYCGQAVNLLKDNKSLYADFYPSKIITNDMDKDGSSEILLDGNVGRVIVLKGKQIGQFVEVGCLQMLGGDLCVSALATPSRVDWNHDGLDDLIIGDSGGWLTFWPGTKDPLVYGSPTYIQSGGKTVFQQAGQRGSIQGPSERRWGYIYPTVCDWDEDGRDEIITNNINSEVLLFEREGEGGIDLALPEPFTKDGSVLPAAWRVRVDMIPSSARCFGAETPCLLYLDWEGDLAVGIPKSKGSTEIIRIEKLKYDSGKNIRLCGPEGHWGRTKLAVADWDSDGDWDVLFGMNGKPIQYFLDIKPGRSTVFFVENCGTSSKPVFKKPVLITTADGSMIDCGGHNASICPTDLDKDGKLDLLIGVENGKIMAFYRKDLSTKAF